MWVGKTLLSNGQPNGEEDTDIKGISVYKSVMTHSTTISNKGCERKEKVLLGSRGEAEGECLPPVMS